MLLASLPGQSESQVPPGGSPSILLLDPRVPPWTRTLTQQLCGQTAAPGGRLLYCSALAHLLLSDKCAISPLSVGFY